jgi:hypothetical protein
MKVVQKGFFSLELVNTFSLIEPQRAKNKEPQLAQRF